MDDRTNLREMLASLTRQIEALEHNRTSIETTLRLLDEIRRERAEGVRRHVHQFPTAFPVQARLRQKGGRQVPCGCLIAGIRARGVPANEKTAP